jgi:RecA-family ATPase
VGTGAEPKSLCVAILPKPPNLLIEQGRAQLVATALDVSKAMQARFGIPLRLIVIDTMLAAFDIRDWNDPAETRRVMNTLSRIAEETSTVVLGIHHHGKDVARGAAGSYALTAAAERHASRKGAPDDLDRKLRLGRKAEAFTRH